MMGRTGHTSSVGNRTVALREAHARMLAVKIALLVFFVVVILRLIQIQLLEARHYQEIAARQHEVRTDLPAQRGDIYDRLGRPLVTNTHFVSFGADPVLVGNRLGAVADRFGRVFDKPRSAYIEKFSSGSKNFVWLERRVDPSVEQRINPAEFKGIIAIAEGQRLYHYDHLAGQLLGFTNIDNNGLSGLELQLDSLLRGRNGWVVLQRDGLGRRQPSVEFPRVEPVDGHAVWLTIDIQYQSIVEEELRKGVERNKAESGLAVMMDPATGEVLAMANYPAMDPANPSSTPVALARNRVVTDVFEPGSVFKVVTASAALERDLVKPTQQFYAEEGHYRVFLPNGNFRNEITDTHKHGMITFQEAMEVSSNIVMAKVSDLIGAQDFYQMARRYGFGTEAGIDLPGEVRGELRIPAQWSGTTLNSMAYGYGVSVTPLQIVCAYAAVANGGTLMKPHVVKEITASDGTVVTTVQPETIRRVVSKKTVEVLTQFFRGVVERGTATAAKLPSVSIAGKTGTAKKVENGVYVEGDYTASFVGYFPAEAPTVVCLVMIENPRDRDYTGGRVAAPVFRAIAEKVVATSTRFAPHALAETVGGEQYSVPDVSSLKVDAARTLLRAQGFLVDVQGAGTIVTRQEPSPGTKVKRGSTVVVSGDLLRRPATGFALVPDVRGFPIRRAMNRLSSEQFGVTVTGTGIVTSQRPAPGERVKVGTSVVIRCEPRTASLVNLY